MLNAAVVGLGWWGRKIVTTLAGNRRIRVVAGVDPDADIARDLIADHGLRYLDDYDKALADEAIDAVILATPYSLHEAQLVAAAAAGKQIFCEKPLALTADSARRMLRACADAGIVLGIGHERRYEHHFEAIEQRVRAGALGTPMHIEANFSHDKFTKVDPANWRGQTKDAPAAGMTGMGIHLTDAFTNLFGPVARVYAHTAQRVLAMPTGDIVSVQLEFASGATGYLVAISATPFYGRLTVFGADGWLEARDDAHVEEGGISRLTVCDAAGRRTETAFEPYDAVRANFEAWAAAVAGAGDYRFRPEQMFQNIATLEAIVRSAASGQSEPVAGAL